MTRSKSWILPTLAALLLSCPAVRAAPMRDWPVTTQYDHGADVRVVQSLLAAQGSLVAVESFFGRRTEKALRQFQPAHSSPPAAKRATQPGKL